MTASAIGAALGAFYVFAFCPYASLIAIIPLLMLGYTVGFLTRIAFMIIDVWRGDWRVALRGLAVWFMLPTTAMYVDSFSPVEDRWRRLFNRLTAFAVVALACALIRGVYWLYVKFRAGIVAARPVRKRHKEGQPAWSCYYAISFGR